MALGVFILLALRIASVATFALFSVLLPILFSLIHIPRTRRRMLEIGDAGQRGLARARDHIRYQLMGGRVPPELEHFFQDQPLDGSASERGGPRTPASRQRVSADTDAAEVDDAKAHEAEVVEPHDSHPPSRARR